MEGLKYCLCKVSSPQGIIALSLTWDGVEEKGILWYYFGHCNSICKIWGRGGFCFLFMVSTCDWIYSYWSIRPSTWLVQNSMRNQKGILCWNVPCAVPESKPWWAALTSTDATAWAKRRCHDKGTPMAAHSSSSNNAQGGMQWAVAQ